MINKNQTKCSVAVIGAGPAGIFAAKQLAQSNIDIALINRDIRPGGLAEYGIYYNKYKMKSGLRRQFRDILGMPDIYYFGNVEVNKYSELRIDTLRELGFSAILVAVGAQGTKWLGLPGEELKGVYHAKDIVYHYNKLPPFSTKEFFIGQHIALIGVGNVMMDIAHWVIRDLKVSETIAVARRGPAEIKFSKNEMLNIARNLELDTFNAEIVRVSRYMEAAGQSPIAAKDFILAAFPNALDPVSNTRFRFEFLSSPSRILGDVSKQVCGLEVEDTKLILKNGDTKAIKLGTKRLLDVDTVIFCIGDRVDEDFGLPVEWNEYVKNPNPQFPVNGISYEAFDIDRNQSIPDIFIAGWAREASSGLVGLARKDGVNGAKAALQYLNTKASMQAQSSAIKNLELLLGKKKIRYVTNDDVLKLEAWEQEKACELNLEEYKLKTNEEMLKAIF
jgi:ferredoxin/flavodoxin---NADP+ reductase